MFYGTFRHAVDTKGRVALPAQFRRDLTGAVLAPGSERRLVIRPAAEWSAYEQHFRLTAGSNAQQRQFIRQLYAQAREVEVDGQGRILLSPEHRAFAGIGERAVFVGVSTAVEVVGEEIWDADAALYTPDAFTQLGDTLAASVAPSADERP